MPILHPSLRGASACLAALALATGCTLTWPPAVVVAPPAAPEAPAAAPAATSAAQSVAIRNVAAPTRIVRDILTRPGWEGREVIIIGDYRGWNLTGSAADGPPVTRGDWVVEDASGAIYVAYKDVPFEGGERPSPSQAAATPTLLELTAVVRATRHGQRYLEPLRIKVWRQ